MESDRAAAYRLYMAEAARCISESAAKMGGGPYITAKWADIIDPKPADERTPDDVKNHMLQLLRTQ